MLNPWFVTGFTDGEGSFTLSIYKDEKYKTGWRVRLFFEIHLHKKDLKILENIRKFFDVGKLYNSSSARLCASEPIFIENKN